MKSAEERVKQLHYCDQEFQLEDEDLIALIKEIQLDAIKEGMRRASIINEQYVPALLSKNVNRAILTIADQLTEKDL